jgi:hypothetical protein
MSILLRIESLLPRKVSHAIQLKLGYSGDYRDMRKKVGFIACYPLFAGIITTVAAAFFYSIQNAIMLYIAYFAGIIMTFIALYLLIDYQAMIRAKKLEENLPDALELIAVNISSGQTIENSLVESARPEFGELALFLKNAAKEMFSGNSLDKSFREMGEKTESEIMKRTILLINEGMKKGAGLGDLLLRISNDLRGESALKNEINANISMYIMLILISSVIGAPVLFGAGAVVSQIFAKQTVGITSDASAGRLPLLGMLVASSEKGTSFTLEDIQTVSIASIALTSLFASLMIGIIRYNKETQGLRYFPVLLIISLIIFFISSILLKQFVIR